MQRSMTTIGIRAVATLAIGAGIILPSQQATAAESSNMSLARQLNNAFIEVADKVSPSVVVIRVAHKNRVAALLDGEEGQQWELIPREFRKQLEEYFKKQKEQE